MCEVLEENGAFVPTTVGMLSKCRFDGAEGTEDRVLELRTMRCRVRDEKSHFRGGRDMTSNTSLT